MFMNGVGESLKLNHEIESYDHTTGKLTAWIDLPTISSTTDTTFYMYYGNSAVPSQQNPTRVSDTNYVLVIHLNENSGKQYDSTSNNNDGTPSSVNQGVSGKIAGGDNFATGSSYVECTSDSSLSPSTLTVEAWIKPSTISGSHPIIEKYDYQVGRGGYLIRQIDNNLFFDILEGQTDHLVWANNVLQVGNWYHIVGTFDGISLKIYVNGQLINQLAWSGTNLASSATLKIGARGNDGPSGGTFSGIIDEVRVSNAPRSTDWIITEFNNQQSPSGFYSIGAETERPATLGSCDSAGTQKDTFNPSETIYAYGTGFSPNTPLTIYVVIHQDVWTTGDSLTDINHSPTSATTDATGNLQKTSVWIQASPGLYDIIVDANNNVQFDAGEARDTANITPGGTGGFFVVPEYLLGSLAALAACFAAFIAYKKRESFPKLKHPT